MNPEGSTLYPLPLSDWTIYGAAEGNFGKILVPTAISYMDGFERIKEDGVKYYSNGSISVGVPETGILLFSTGDYLEAKDKTLDNRSLLIPSELASDMAENLFSIYVSEPKTMMDLGFELPYAVLSGMNYALITVDETNEGFFLSSVVDFKDERDAKTFTTLMRNMIVQEIRRDGGKLDFKALSDMIVCERNRSYINDREMTREELLAECSERIELKTDDTARACAVLDSMGIENYKVTDASTVNIFERLDGSGDITMALAQAGVKTLGITVRNEGLEDYYLSLTGGAKNV